MKVTPKTIHQKMVKQQAVEILDHLTVDEACVYLDSNCTEDEREEIVAAIWEEYHDRCARRSR